MRKQVFDAFFQRFHMAVHHGGGGGETQLMCLIHHLQPLIGGTFFGADDFAYAVDQDFSTASGNGIQPCGN